MSGRSAALFGALALAGTSAPALAAPAPVRTALAVCAPDYKWTAPAPPAQVFGNTYYVGTCGISSILVTSPKGHVLIDAGPPGAAPLIAANIVRLGFNPKDVRWIVTSHEHYDHVGDLAALKTLTGAKLAARLPAAQVLRTGQSAPDDPQAGTLRGFDPVEVDAIVGDRGGVTVGPLVLTARATPGHTDGSTSWSWQSCEGADCRRITYVDSLTAVRGGSYRFSAHPHRVAMLRRTIGRIAKLDCGVLLTPHPDASGLFRRLADEAPLSQPGDCRALAESATARLDAVLAEERAKAPK